MYKHEIYAELLSCAKIVAILCLLRFRLPQDIHWCRCGTVSIMSLPMQSCLLGQCLQGGWGGDLWEVTQRPQEGVSLRITLSTSAMPHKRTLGEQAGHSQLV